MRAGREYASDCGGLIEHTDGISEAFDLADGVMAEHGYSSADITRLRSALADTVYEGIRRGARGRLAARL